MISVPLSEITYTYWRDDQGGTRNRNLVPRGRTFDPDRMWRGTESYRDMLIELLMRPADPQRGFDLAEMRRANKVIDKLEALHEDAESVEFEDAEWEAVRARIEAGKWNVASKDFERFVDDVLNAKSEQERRDREEKEARRLLASAEDISGGKGADG